MALLHFSARYEFFRKSCEILICCSCFRLWSPFWASCDGVCVGVCGVGANWDALQWIWFRIGNGNASFSPCCVFNLILCSARIWYYSWGGNLKYRGRRRMVECSPILHRQVHPYIALDINCVKNRLTHAVLGPWVTSTDMWNGICNIVRR